MGAINKKKSISTFPIFGHYENAIYGVGEHSYENHQQNFFSKAFILEDKQGAAIWDDSDHLKVFDDQMSILSKKRT